MKPQFCVTKILLSLWTSLVLLGALMSAACAADSIEPKNREITTYYQITTKDLEGLGDTIKAEAGALISGLQPQMEMTDYIASLETTDYAEFLKTFVQKLPEPEFFELVDSHFSSYYDLFVDRASEAEFAQMFREYLGELTVDYLTIQPQQEFTEYVLSRTLRLTEEDYSNLYKNYIETLWQYYVTSASPEELIQLLGSEYPDPVASAAMAIDNKQYFSRLADHITTIDEAEFIANYSDYIMEMTGGLLLKPAAQDASPAAPVDPQGEANADATSTPATPAFVDLSIEESFTLIRRHIAAVAKTNFVTFFRQSLIQDATVYTSASSLQELSRLNQLTGFAALLQQELAKRNALDLRRLESMNAFANDEFIAQVGSELKFVGNIPYPNMRLLRIAVSHVLKRYNPDSPVEGLKLSKDQFQILYQAAIGSASLYDESGPIYGPASSLQAGAEDGGTETDESTEPDSGNGEIRWNFLGCGCEIDLERVIYGFYPAWEVPMPDSAPQEIDLKYYDRVAYFGLTLFENGDISDDKYWREGGALNRFIQDAHMRDTHIDLSIYSPTWYLLEGTRSDTAISNIIEKLSIPLQFNFLDRFASNYLVPIYPTYSETIGKNTMGDGVTLYFDNLEDEKTGELRDLSIIDSLVRRLARDLAAKFPEDVPPIHLMLDFKRENTVEVLRKLRPLILGTELDPDRYVAQVLMFLEQDTWSSSENLIDAIRLVFKDDDSSGVFKKLAPILVPAMNEVGLNDKPGAFPSLTRDLNDLRWTFGTAGGAAIWPIPIENAVNSDPIEAAFVAAMVENESGLWASIKNEVRKVHFKYRLVSIFAMTSLYLISIAILVVSIWEPMNRIVLLLAKVIGSFAFFMFMFTNFFIDPYIHSLRVVSFLLPLLFVIGIGALQSALPSRAVNTKDSKTASDEGAPKVSAGANKYVSREIKKQKSRFLRRLQRKVRQGLRFSRGS